MCARQRAADVSSSRDTRTASQYRGQKVRTDLDPTLFDATIVPISEQGPRWYGARGKYDTAADANFISRDIVRRAGLEPDLKPTNKEHEFHSVNNFSFVPEWKITVTWYLDNAPLSRHTEFLLVEQSHFDLLIGEPTMKINSFLPLFGKVRSKGELDPYQTGKY
jgi:hypothetical protein